MDTIRQSFLEVYVLVDGLRLPIYEKNGRRWIAGEPGKPYTICARLLTNDRVEVLESVDGRNALQDEPAALSNNGMIIRGLWENDGWRINDSEVRRFVFSDPAASIAAQATGNVANVGVIGVAAFVEKSPFRYRPAQKWEAKSIDLSRHEGVATTDFANDGVVRSAYSAQRAASADLGTGMGELKTDVVSHTIFERASTFPEVRVEIQYRTRAWLVEQGIITSELPRAWPGSETGYGKYVK